MTENARRESAEVLRILLVVQAAAGLLAMLGEVVLMAGPLYAVVPVAKAILLLVLAAAVAAGRRWALVTTIVVEGLGLLGVGLSMAVALVPQLGRTMTLTGLLTEVGLPLAVIALAALQLARTPRRPGGAAARTPIWTPPPSSPPLPPPPPSRPHATLRLPESPSGPGWSGRETTPERTVDLADGLPDGWPRPTVEAPR